MYEFLNDAKFASFIWLFSYFTYNNEYVLVHVRHVDTLAVFPFLSALGHRVKRCLSFLQRVKTLKVHVFQAFFLSLSENPIQ